jgi:Zn-dependent M32 family carboxypeptidase
VQAVKRDSSIAPALEQGDYAPLKVWLTENIWRHGMTRVLLLPCATHAISDLKTLVVCQDRLRTETCSGNLTDKIRRPCFAAGRRYTRDELLVRATGRPMEAGPYIAYLAKKHGGGGGKGERAKM